MVTDLGEVDPDPYPYPTSKKNPNSDPIVEKKKLGPDPTLEKTGTGSDLEIFAPYPRKDWVRIRKLGGYPCISMKVGGAPAPNQIIP